MTAIRIIDDHTELAGLGDDDHTQYPLLAGRAGGQTLIGGTTTIADLTLQTTSGIGATGADMHFLVGNDGGTEAMTILNNGDVGIGTTTPSATLEISSAGAVESSLSLDQTGTSDSTIRLRMGGATKGIIGVDNSDGDKLQFGLSWIGGGAKMTIDNTGKVGIGDASPNQLLGLFGTNAQISVEESDTEFLRMGVGETAHTAVIGWDDADALQLGLYSSPTDTTIDSKMTILANGNVGIGDTAPTALLDINSDILRLRTAKTPATAGAAGNQGDICWDANYLYICTATNAWERAALASW